MELNLDILQLFFWIYSVTIQIIYSGKDLFPRLTICTISNIFICIIFSYFPTWPFRGQNFVVLLFVYEGWVLVLIA